MLNWLVVRACAIGDFVLNLPALKALQERHREVRFTLVGYPATLELARDFVDVAAIHSIESEPWSRLFWQPVQGLEFSRATVWMRDSAFAENLRLSGVSEVHHAAPFPIGDNHAASHLLATLHLPAPILPDLWKPESDRVILHPGSGSPAKCWPYFDSLAAELESVEFLIGPAEESFDCGDYPALRGLSLRSAAKLLASSRAFVGNDSGITHLAAYLGCPTLAIFRSTDPRIWGPIGRHVQVMHEPGIAEVKDWVQMHSGNRHSLY